MSEKIKEIQEYLKEKGFMVAEPLIVDMAIDIARRNRLGVEVFAHEAKAREDKKESEKWARMTR